MAALDGRRGWTTVGGLGALLTALLVPQVGTITAAAAGPAAPALPGVSVSATGPLAPSAGPAPDDAAAEAGIRRGHLIAAQAEAERVEAQRLEAQRAADAAEAARAQAQQADDCSGPGWQQRRGAAALASLKGGAARTGFSLEFGPARSGFMGLTHLDQRRIEVFVRPCSAQSFELLRHVTAHEMGHGYDTTHLTEQRRTAWKAARGIPASTPWFGCSHCTDFATPAGDFAEVYAQWARGATTNRSALAGAPGPAELQRLAREFFGA